MSGYGWSGLGPLVGLVNWSGEVCREVENKLPVDDYIIVGLFQVSCKHFYSLVSNFIVMTWQPQKHTISPGIQIDDGSNPNIDDTEKALVLLLKLLLVEYLDCQYTLFRNTSACPMSVHPPLHIISLWYNAYKSKLSFQYGFNVFLMTVVVLVCSPLTVTTANGSGNPTTVC
jgi:hypothetical protein